eukprot:TRINITY_DN8061_c0_g1_i1.p4 TRINITY_DN8061_c0_g1~~TRINITY_DN8061_c0_g1_i1.p4  ORF type:complete len:121 (-),score=43.19 TRINITY_DN8061_c0_g1_i1:224-586(-)
MKEKELEELEKQKIREEEEQKKQQEIEEKKKEKKEKEKEENKYNNDNELDEENADMNNQYTKYLILQKKLKAGEQNRRSQVKGPTAEELFGNIKQKQNNQGFFGKYFCAFCSTSSAKQGS